MPGIADIRHYGKVLCDKAIQDRWPYKPIGTDGSRSSGLDCATIVARAMWRHLKAECWSEFASTDDAITTYACVDFLRDCSEDALVEIWSKARELAMRQQNGVVDDSFSGICRSPGFVKAFWADPLLQLTAPHLKVGPDYLQGQVVLDGEDLARQATVAWDGLKPPTLQAAINNITRAEHDGHGNTTYIFFKNPALLQVDLTPSQGSTHSLVDIWRFTADKWTIVPVRSGVGTCTYEKAGQQTYTIMAVVLHRKSNDGVDFVRLFSPAGKEEVPMNRRTPTRWPFELDDAIPAGCKLTLFYTSFSEPRNTPLSIEPAATVETDDESLDIYMSDYKERSLASEAWRYASNRSRPSPSSQPPNGPRPDGAMKRKTAEDREMGHDGLKRQKLPDRGALMATSVTGANANPPPPHTESEPHTTNTLRTSPAIRVQRVPAQPIPHERTSNAPPTNLQPPTARPADRVPIPLPPPTGPRADRGVEGGMNSDGEVGNDDHKRPKLTDALPRGAAMAPTSLTRSDAQGAGAPDNGSLPGESTCAAQGDMGPQRNHAEGPEILTPHPPPQPCFALPSSVTSRARPQLPLLSSVSPQPSFPNSPAPATASGRRGRRGSKKSSGHRGRG